jgi:hypothetical protein
MFSASAVEAPSTELIRQFHWSSMQWPSTIGFDQVDVAGRTDEAFMVGGYAARTMCEAITSPSSLFNWFLLRRAT